MLVGIFLRFCSISQLYSSQLDFVLSVNLSPGLWTRSPETHTHNLAVEEDSLPWQLYRTFPENTLIGHPESHVSAEKKCEERDFMMIDNPTWTTWESESISPLSKGCWVGQLNMSIAGHSSPLHYWMRHSFLWKDSHPPMKNNQPITPHSANLHQETVGLGWPLK